MLRIGAHKSSSGGYTTGVAEVHEIGGNCLQIFSSAPRNWRPGNPTEEDKQTFLELRKEYDIDPVYFHASYMINLAGSPENREKSINALVAELVIAHKFNVRGSVIHLGSFKNGVRETNDQGLFAEEAAYDVLFKSIERILTETPDDILFIIENMGMRKIGMSLEEIGYIVKKLNSPRVKICLDTCHLHAAGYDISSPEKLDAFLDKFDQLIGLDLLELWHVNDSRDTFGALRDRHENIGEGSVGSGVFEALINSTRVNDRPFIIETPGFSGGGPDKENLDRLKAFVH
ncbi:MAG: deoxyribonuclease IV [Candidatus Paceibacterota bacterium]